MVDSSNSFALLQGTMREACEPEREWPAKLAAGIRAGLGFVAANPDAARALVTERQSGRSSGSPYQDLLNRLGALLGEIAPRDPRLPDSTDQAVVGGIVAVIVGHLHRDRLDQLAALGPDLVYLALLPYLGFSEAKSWTQSVAGLPLGGPQ
jgi:hypothetical protein